MAPKYPNVLPSFTTKVDYVDDAQAADMNDVQNEVVAVATELGTNPKGTFASVAARLGAMSSARYGLTLSNGGDAVNDIDVAAGFCPSNDAAAADVIPLEVPALTKQLDAAYAAGTNAGMRLAAEGLADGTWGIWAFHPTTGADDIFASLLANPNPPSGTKKQLLGAIVRSGATIVGFTQNVNRFDLNVPVISYNVTNPGAAAVTVTANVPTVWSVEAIVAWNVYVPIAQYPLPGLITPLDVADTAPSGTVFSFYCGVPGGGNQASGIVRVRTNTSAQFRGRLGGSDGNTELRFVTHGWVFHAGIFA
jgi:hypothetical protein